VDPDSYDGAVALEWQARAMAQLAHRVPAMAEAGWRRSWAQVDGYTSDGHMVLGQTANLDGLYVAAGMSGSGFKTGPAVGMCIAELILEGQSSTADIAPFRLTRFEENDPIIGSDDYEIPEFVLPSMSP
jgi:sarcosine oxidase subunit beta